MDNVSDDMVVLTRLGLSARRIWLFVLVGLMYHAFWPEHDSISWLCIWPEPRVSERRGIASFRCREKNGLYANVLPLLHLSCYFVCVVLCLLVIMRGPGFIHLIFCETCGSVSSVYNVPCVVLAAGGVTSIASAGGASTRMELSFPFGHSLEHSIIR